MYGGEKYFVQYIYCFSVTNYCMQMQEQLKKFLFSAHDLNQPIML